MKTIKRIVEFEISVSDDTEELVATADLEIEIMELCKEMTTNKQIYMAHGNLDDEPPHPYRDIQFQSIKVTAIKNEHGEVW